jgi:WD40 repeat protein
VSISADGTTFVVGTFNQFGTGRGLVDVYKLNSSLRTYTKVGSTIDESDVSSVSISADGLTFVVGSPGYKCINPKRFDCGYVTVYKLDALAMVYKQYGDTIYGEPDDLLGNSVSISADGTTFAVGTYAQAMFEYAQYHHSKLTHNLILQQLTLDLAKL